MNINFIKNLKRIRQLQNMSQYKLAKIMGVSNSRIVEWEAGTYEPSMENLIKLAAALNCTIDELVK